MIEGGMRCEAGQETHRAGRMSCVPHHRGGSLFEASLREAPQDEAFFLMPSITCPHAEERPGPAGAHLEARTAPDAAHSCPASALFRLRRCCHIARPGFASRKGVPVSARRRRSGAGAQRSP
jgi:hypothetical protein